MAWSCTCTWTLHGAAPSPDRCWMHSRTAVLVSLSNVPHSRSINLSTFQRWLQVATDTAVFGPVHVGGYFVVMAAAEGSDWAALRAKMAVDFLPTLVADVTVWPWLQSVNFKFTPLQYQLLVVNAFVIVDSTFMSWARATDDWVAKIAPGLARRLRGVPQSEAQESRVRAGQGTE